MNDIEQFLYFYDYEWKDGEAIKLIEASPILSLYFKHCDYGYMRLYKYLKSLEDEWYNYRIT